MKRQLLRWAAFTSIWLLLSVSLGALVAHFFDLGFWLASASAGLSLVVNGIIAEWEDR